MQINGEKVGILVFENQFRVQNYHIKPLKTCQDLVKMHSFVQKWREVNLLQDF